MNDMTMIDAYGVLTEARTLTIQRLLPGPIDRVWSYLVEGDLRRQWLAAGDMTLEVGALFELVWQNNELTTPAGTRPDGMTGEHRMAARITEVDPPRRLAFTWDETGGVAIDLAPAGDRVLLTLTHRDLPRRSMLLGVSAGWHAHLDLLDARLAGAEPTPFWDRWTTLRAEYDARLPE